MFDSRAHRFFFIDLITDVLVHTCVCVGDGAIVQ